MILIIACAAAAAIAVGIIIRLIAAARRTHVNLEARLRGYIKPGLDGR